MVQLSSQRKKALVVVRRRDFSSVGSAYLWQCNFLKKSNFTKMKPFSQLISDRLSLHSQPSHYLIYLGKSVNFDLVLFGVKCCYPILRNYNSFKAQFFRLGDAGF